MVAQNILCALFGPDPRAVSRGEKKHFGVGTIVQLQVHHHRPLQQRLTRRGTRKQYSFPTDKNRTAGNPHRTAGNNPYDLPIYMKYAFSKRSRTIGRWTTLVSEFRNIPPHLNTCSLVHSPHSPNELQIQPYKPRTDSRLLWW
jgi:hypothetical protein